MCVQRSFSGTDKYKSTNHLLEESKNSTEYSSVYLVPALFINNVMVKEDLTNKLVSSALCARLKSTP